MERALRMTREKRYKAKGGKTEWTSISMHVRRVQNSTGHSKPGAETLPGDSSATAG